MTGRPNRAERRRQARAAGSHNRMPVIVAGAGIVAASLGDQFEARPSADLPPKVEGKHRWIAAAAYVLRDVDVERADDPAAIELLDNENLMQLSIGCWDCEEPLGAVAAGSVCEGDPAG